MSDNIAKKFKIEDESNIHRTKDVICEENITFSQLNLRNDILKGLSDNGFKYPSPIQFKSIPMGLLGLDLIIQAKSGTGKTCVFSVLTLESINVSSKVPQVLILSPTREIAMQSKNVITSIGSHLENINCHLFIGGTKVFEDLKNLKNCNIIVGTPGRIKYLIEQNHLQVDSIRLFVLDEADMLFADNFQNIINWIYNSLPTNKQMITLSATYTEDMINIVTQYMKSPVMIRLNNNEKASLFGIRHYFKEITNTSNAQQTFWFKTEILMDILSSVDFQQCIIFSNFQSVAQDLCDALESNGWSAAYISGNLDQSQRIEIFNKLKSFHCRVLVATDLISRGIDAENVNLIINLEVPMEFETYLHRMGRAGRYGSYGAVINIVTSEEKLFLYNIKHMCDIRLEKIPEVIPCDLLEEGYTASHSEVTVEKLADSQNINNVYKLFQVGRQNTEHKYATKANEELKKEILSFQDILESQRNFKHRSSNREDLVVVQSITDWFNPVIYELVEKHLLRVLTNQSMNSYTKSKVGNTECRCDTDEHYAPGELDALEMEYGRLYSWAINYSQEYQRVTNLINTKSQELNELMML